MGKGGHIGALDVGGTRVVGDGIGSTGSYHGRGELRGASFHELARVSMITSLTRWPPVGGHPAMEVTIECSLVGRVREVRGRLVSGVPVFSLPFLPCFLSLPCCLLPFLSDEAGAGAEAGRGYGYW